MINSDAESSSLSAGDGGQTGDEATARERRSPVSSLPADADDTAAANDWCAWCGRGPSTDEDFDVDETWPSAGDDGGPNRRAAYDQLRFCSRSCLSRYKMDLFCRETQRYLQQLQVAVSCQHNYYLLRKSVFHKGQGSFLIIRNFYLLPLFISRFLIT